MAARGGNAKRASQANSKTPETTFHRSIDETETNVHGLVPVGLTAQKGAKRHASISLTVLFYVMLLASLFNDIYNRKVVRKSYVLTRNGFRESF